MPGFDGTGPHGRGPMTGGARGYCILRKVNGDSGRVQGFAGVQGTPVEVESSEAKEAPAVPQAGRARPAVSRAMAGRPVMFPVPGYGHPVLMGVAPPLGLPAAAPYGYAWPRWGRGSWGPGPGQVLGCGRGRGRGRGRCGFPW